MKKKRRNFKIGKKKFDYFGSLSDRALRTLEGALSSEASGGKTEAIQTAKQKCEAESRRFKAALAKEFLPPIEREDLFFLSYALDMFTDKISFAAELFSAYGKENAGVLTELCRSAVRLAEETGNFKNQEKLSAAADRLTDAAEQGKKLCREGIKKCISAGSSEEAELFRAASECCDAAAALAAFAQLAAMKNC